MNPAWFLLAPTFLACLVVALRPGTPRRRETAGVLALLLLAGVALLLPALATSGGLPSPAATVGELPPWRGTVPAEGGNPLLRDVTFQIQPWLLHLRHELREGRWPFWNPHQFAGTPFWANGQSAPLFPLHLLFAALPLELGFMLLPLLRLAIGGLGAFRLARALGISLEGAALAAVVYPLSGMLVSFLLFPMGNALCLVPWVFLAAEAVAAGRRGAVLGLGLATGLQLLGGHPETAVHTALLTGIYLAVRGSGEAEPGRLRQGLGFAGGWGLGGALSAVQTVPLLAMLLETSRWREMAEGAGALPFGLLLEQPLRLVLPQLYGHPAQGTWWGPFNYSATAVFVGIGALVLAFLGMGALRGDRHFRAWAVVLGAAFVIAYHWPIVRDVVAAVPVLGRAAQHRLIFGIELGLALFAARGLDRWRAGQGGRAGIVAAVLVLAGLAVATLLHGSDWAQHGLGAGMLGAIVVAVALAVAIPLLGRLSAPRRVWVARALPLVVAVELVAAHGAILGRIERSDLYPETGAVRFLAGRDGRVVGTSQALRPNTALVYGLFDVRGDDPVKLARYEAIYGHFANGDPVYFEPITDWGSPWLDRLGVRWVVAAPAEEAPAGTAWEPAYDGSDARVFERPSALPLVRWAGEGPGEVTVTSREPGHWGLRWRAVAPGRIVIAENWDAGWSAEDAAGSRRPVALAEEILLGVDVPAGDGSLRLAYRPVGLVPGAIASGVALVVLGIGSLRLRRRFPEKSSARLRRP